METTPYPAEGATHYRLLGVGPLAPQDLVVEAYWFRSRPPGEPMPPEGVLKRLNDAYATLVDPERRDRYNESAGLPLPSRHHFWQQPPRAPHEWLQVDPVSGRDLVPLAYAIMREHWLEAVALGRVKRDALRRLDEARDALLAAEGAAPPPAARTAPERGSRRVEVAPLLRSGVAGLARGLRALLQGPPLPPPEPQVENGAAEERMHTLTPRENDTTAAPAPEAAEPPVPAFLSKAAAPQPEEPPETVEEPPAESRRTPQRPPAADPLVPVKSAPPDAIEGAYLTWTDARGDVVAVPIEEFLRVGTHNLCEIRLAGEEMPEELVRIWRDPDGRYVLRHMPPSGVISVNGKPMIWAELEDGDVIDFFGCLVTFRQAAPVTARDATG